MKKLKTKPEEQNEYCEECEDFVKHKKHICISCGEKTHPDLFNDLEKVPQKVQSAINEFDNDNLTYKECSRILKKVEKLGYTFEYYLDAEPYALRSIAH